MSAFVYALLHVPAIMNRNHRKNLVPILNLILVPLLSMGKLNIRQDYRIWVWTGLQILIITLYILIIPP